MHREIQIKQFLIVTTHWWSKTQNERFVWENEQYLLGMHDIYRTDKLSTDMGENDVIFIAPINKWNPITRSDKVACW